MTKFRNIRIAILFIALVGVLAAVYATRQLDFGAYRMPLAQALSLSLSRDVSIEGDIRLTVGWSPKLTLSEVHISNPAWAHSPYLVRAETIDVRVGLRALWERRIDIRQLYLANVTLHLEQNSDGTNNWTFTQQRETENNTEGVFTTAITDVILDNIKIVRHTSDQTISEYALKTATLKVTDAHRYQLAMLGSIADMPIALQLSAYQSAPTIWKFNTKAQINTSFIAGDIDWDTQPTVSHITARLHTPKLDTAAWMRPSKTDDTPSLFAQDITLPGIEHLPKNVAFDLHLSADEILWRSHHLRQIALVAHYAYPQLTLEQVDGRWNDQAFAFNALLEPHVDGLSLQVSANAPILDIASLTQEKIHGQVSDVHFTYATRGDSVITWMRRSKVSAKARVEYLQLGAPRLSLYNATLALDYHPRQGGRGKISGTLLSKNTTLELAMQPLHRAWLYKLDAAIAMRVLYGNTQATLHSSWRELASNVKSFRVQLRGQRLPELGELFQSRLPNFLRYDISAKLFLADDNLTGTQILIETPTSFVTGALFYQWPEHTLPVLRLRLAHSTFDVAEMKAAFATNAIVDAALRTTLIPDQPMAAFLDIPLAMDIVGANININEPALPVNKLDFNLRIAPGIIDAKYRIDEISKGRINGALLMASAPQDVALKFNMDVKNFDYGHALSRAGINNNIMGTADATVDFIGRGATIKSLLRNANARIDINGGKGVIVNRYLRLWGDDIVRQFLPGNWLQDEQSKLNCAYARLHLNDGALRAEAMVLDTEHITVVGGGGLDMASEKLDFVLTPNPKNPSLLSLATPVRIRGNLVQPEIATHKMATLWTIGTLAVGVANPVVLLARFANLGNLGEDACRQSAVDAAPHEPSVPVKLVKHLNSLVTLVQRPFDRLPDLDLGKAMGYLGIDVTQEAPQDANGWTPPFSRSTAMEDPAARK